MQRWLNGGLSKRIKVAQADKMASTVMNVDYHGIENTFVRLNTAKPIQNPKLEIVEQREIAVFIF